MARTDLGKVCVTPKGAWSSGTAYEFLDIVSNGGSSYLALQDVPANTALTNTSYWFVLAAKGDKGDTGTMTVGSTTTGNPGTDASVTNSGTSTAAVWNFTIPRGATGNGIASITLLSSELNVDTYRITYTDGDHFDFEVTNASSGVWGSITGTLSDQTDLQAQLDSKAPIIEESASGDIVSIEDGAPLPVSALSVGIEPVQDLHGYDNPWPAGGGKNLLDTTQTVTVSGITFTPDSNGYITASPNDADSRSINYASRQYSATLEAGTYILSGDAKTTTTNTGAMFGFIDSSDNAVLAYKTYTLANTSTISYTFTLASTTTVGLLTKLFNSSWRFMIRKSTDSADWSPFSNICPISGHSTANVTRTGKNLNPMLKFYQAGYSAEINDVTFTVQADGGIKMQGTASGQANFYFCSSTIQNVPRLYFKNGTYTFSATGLIKIGNTNSTKIVISGTNGNGYAYQELTKATPSNSSTVMDETKPFDYIIFRVESGTNVDTTVYLQVETGSSATPYEPPHIQSISIPLGSTVYGGTLDVLTGTLTVTMAKTDLSTLTWAYVNTTGHKQFYASLPSAPKNPPDVKTAGNVVCSALTNTSYYDIYNNTVNNTIAVNPQQENRICVYVESITTVPDFTTAMSGVQFVYELATPTTTTLTAQQMSTLLGSNRIWADTGDTSVTYRADTKLFVEQAVDSAVTAVKRIMTTTTTEMKAPKNLTSGEIVIVGDELYKATANIASGATLTVGSNVVKVTLAEWVASLVA